jgi:hypothetical protein
MARFATGRFAFGISDRSGFRYKLNEMRKEWNGLLVGPDEYEAKQPQLQPTKVGVGPQALLNPRPDSDNPTSAFLVKTTNSIYSAAPVQMPSEIEITTALGGSVGTVSVTTT